MAERLAGFGFLFGRQTGGGHGWGYYCWRHGWFGSWSRRRDDHRRRGSRSRRRRGGSLNGCGRRRRRLESFHLLAERLAGFGFLFGRQTGSGDGTGDCGLGCRSRFRRRSRSHDDCRRDGGRFGCFHLGGCRSGSIQLAHFLAEGFAQLGILIGSGGGGGLGCRGGSGRGGRGGRGGSRGGRFSGRRRLLSGVEFGHLLSQDDLGLGRNAVGIPLSVGQGQTRAKPCQCKGKDRKSHGPKLSE